MGLYRKTAYGDVKGVHEKEGRVSAFYGIAYGAPVCGNRRFKAPMPPASWNGVKDARTCGASLPQPLGGGIAGEEGELTLDLLRPDTGEDNLPICFHIHGGGNTCGDSRELDFAGFCAKMNCVVVSIHYRLGFLGFLNLPALKTGNPYEDSGNFALLDIYEALKWTKENASFFGGDAENILISGSSAGARNVMAMLVSPLFRGMFHKAVSLSGGMGIGDAQQCQVKAAKALAYMVVEDGMCGDLDEAESWIQQKSDHVREYLYSLPASRLILAASKLPGQLPQLFNDGVVIPKEGFFTGKFNEVPLLLFSGKTEFSEFVKTIGWDYFKESIQSGEIYQNESQKRKEFDFAASYTNTMFGLMNTKEAARRLGPIYNAPIYACRLDWGSDAKLLGDEFALFHGANHGCHAMLLDVMTEGRRRDVEPYHRFTQHKGFNQLCEVFTSYYKNFVWNSNPNHASLPKWRAWKKHEHGVQQILDCTEHNIMVSEDTQATTLADILFLLKEDSTLGQDLKSEFIRKYMTNRTWSEAVERFFYGTSMWIPS